MNDNVAIFEPTKAGPYGPSFVVGPGLMSYCCYGCDEVVEGSFPALFGALDPSGRGYCFACEVAYRGRYDLENPALMKIIERYKTRAESLREHIRRISVDEQGYLQVKKEYTAHVRTLTDENYRLYKHVINPLDRPLGPIGERGCYNIDHTAPISMCFDNFVQAEDAAHPRNLQCIPARVNAERGCRLQLNKLVGLPYGYLRGQKHWPL